MEFIRFLKSPKTDAGLTLLTSLPFKGDGKGNLLLRFTNISVAEYQAYICNWTKINTASC